MRLVKLTKLDFQVYVTSNFGLVDETNRKGLKRGLEPLRSMRKNRGGSEAPSSQPCNQPEKERERDRRIQHKGEERTAMFLPPLLHIAAWWEVLDSGRRQPSKVVLQGFA